jgi:2-dehydro-3-deoxy-D-gluconate 5-dehydrogenase
MIASTEQRPLLDLFQLNGKSALVTGGAKGIGRGIALRLAEAGADVSIVDVDEAAAVVTVADIHKRGRKARFVRADLTSASDAKAAVKATWDAFGRLDIVVNNAGIFPMVPALQLDEATWDRTIDVNLKGAFFIAQAAAAYMTGAVGGNAKSGVPGGAIVNIASIDAFHPSGNLAHYDASKGALVMMTRSLAVEWAKSNVRVNGVAPGGIRTPGADASMAAIAKAMGAANADGFVKGFEQRVPLGRMGVPDDIALAALFLASDASSYITGQTLIVDGGVLLV